MAGQIPVPRAGGADDRPHVVVEPGRASRAQLRCPVEQALLTRVGDAVDREEHVEVAIKMRLPEFIEAYPKGCMWCLQRDLAIAKASISMLQEEVLRLQKPTLEESPTG